MYLLAYSLNIFSLMALTVATRIRGRSTPLSCWKTLPVIWMRESCRWRLALQGAREVGFTVLSMSVSLIAVFVPILLMGGLVGRLFREFAMTITVSIVISLVVSMSTTPMMRALLRGERDRPHGRIYHASERVFEAVLNFYRRTLNVALRHPRSVMLVLAATLGMNFSSLRGRPERASSRNRTPGCWSGRSRPIHSISFQLMQRSSRSSSTSSRRTGGRHHRRAGFTGGGQWPGAGGSTNSGTVFVSRLEAACPTASSPPIR